MKETLSATRIAVPYYGSLVRPGKGLEQIYFHCDLDRSSGSVENVSIRVWDSKKGNDLFQWFVDQGIQGLYCETPPAAFASHLARKGIWVEAADCREFPWKEVKACSPGCL